MLVFPFGRDEWEGYLAADEAVWTAFLREQVGFVRKEVWVDVDDDEHVTVVIWWDSREAWKRITADDVAAVDARMGRWYRDCVLHEYRVVRPG